MSARGGGARSVGSGCGKPSMLIVACPEWCTSTPAVVMWMCTVLGLGRGGAGVAAGPDATLLAADGTLGMMHSCCCTAVLRANGDACTPTSLVRENESSCTNATRAAGMCAVAGDMKRDSSGVGTTGLRCSGLVCAAPARWCSPSGEMLPALGAMAARSPTRRTSSVALGVGMMDTLGDAPQVNTAASSHTVGLIAECSALGLSTLASWAKW